MYMWGPPLRGAGVLFNYIISESPVEFLGGFWLGFREFRLPATVFVFGGREYLSGFLEVELANGHFEFLNFVFESRGALAEVDLALESRGLKSFWASRRECPIVILGPELE